MPVKRRSPTTDTSSDSDHEAKRRHVSGIFDNLSIFLIHTKIDPSELEHLRGLGELNGANLIPVIEQADVVVTRISMRKRFERHLKWDLAKQKAIVTPAWITQSVSRTERLPYEDYKAFCSLEECTLSHCPHHNTSAISRSVSPTSAPPKNTIHTSPFAVQRISPLVCANQDLLAQLEVLRNARYVEGEARSAMSYARSIAAIKAYPRKIRTAEQVAHIPFVGPKILSMIRQYLLSGRISETSRMLDSPRYHSLSAFTRIHGIGPSTARELYEAGCRTYEDLDRRFGAEYGEEVHAMAKGEKAGIRTMLELRDEMSIPIPREEVEEISRVISQELQVVEPGCQYLICGGYRRGKTLCNDVDFVFTHPASGKERDLCQKLVDRLSEKGLVTHVLHLSSFRSSHPLHMPTGASKLHSHWDTLDKSLVVFQLPPKEGSMSPRLHRRVDLICSSIGTYWTAVVGWTGSTMFERDLRLWAKQKMGLKFDSGGITRRRDSKLLFPMSERAVFEMLGLEWIDPSLRNADM